MFKLTKLKRDIASGSVAAGISMILIVVSYPIYLQYLGVEIYGLWAAFSIFLVFGELGQFGINQSIIRFIAEAVELNDNGKSVSEYFTGAFIILIIVTIFLSLFYILVKDNAVALFNIPLKYTDLTTDLLFWIFILIPTSFFLQFFQGVLMGFGKVELSNYIFIFGDILKVGISIFLLTQGFHLSAIYFGWLSSNILLIIIYFILCKHNLSQLFLFNKMVYKRMKEIFHFGKYLAGNSIVSMGYIPFITLVITRYIGLSEVTYFNISWKIYSRIKAFFMKGLNGILPHAAKLNILLKTEDDKTLRSNLINLYKKTLKFVYFFGFLPVIIMIVFCDYIMILWLKESFHPMISFSIRVLFFALLFELCSLPIWNIFIAINKPKYNLYSSVIRILSSIPVIIGLFILHLINYRSMILLVGFETLLVTTYLIYKFHALLNNNEKNYTKHF